MRVLFFCLLVLLGAAALSFGADQDPVWDEEDPEFSEEIQETNAAPGEEEVPKTVAQKFLDDSTFFFGYRSAMRTGSDPRLINNHVFFRHTAESLLGDACFYRLDWRARVFPKSDHRADAREDSVYADAHLREGYLLSSHDRFSVRLGSQIHAWGKADTVAVTDVLAPRDMSEFIFFKLEDARFGQVMASADLWGDRTSLFAFVAPRPAVDRLPAEDTHYDLAGDFYIRDQKPDWGDVEAGAKLDIRFPGTEASVMGGFFYANSPLYQDLGAVNGDELARVYPGYGMAGIALDHARQNFIYKLEAAFKHDFPLQALDALGRYAGSSAHVLDAAAGIEYNANGAWEASVEVSNRRILSSREGLVYGDRDASSAYVTFRRDFFHEVLEAEYNYYFHFQDNNSFHNIQLTWDLTDAVRVTARYTVFNITAPGSLMWAYRDEDRAAVEIRYAF